MNHAVEPLVRGDVAVTCVSARGDPPFPRALLSGSFNPLHDGHRQLVAAAGQHLGFPVALELTVRNADKPALSLAEIARRLPPLLAVGDVWLTACPRFVDRAPHFPGVVWVVGVDTAQRILDPRFYEGSARAMEESLATLNRHRNRFLVAGRVDSQGVFSSPHSLKIPAGFTHLFDALRHFRVDQSSTLIRASGSS